MGMDQKISGNIANAKFKLGLALSGGGFRASAFHLGALKRLRELGVLGDVDVVSTVSGGSITGAAWVYWQAFKGDTISDSDEWNKFETKLIDTMHKGLRSRLLIKVCFYPLVILSALWYLLAKYLWVIPDYFHGALFILTFLVLLYFWNRRAGEALIKWYNRNLFDTNVTMKSLHEETDKLKGKRHVPRLIINATALETGREIMLTEVQTFWGLFKDIVNVNNYASKLVSPDKYRFNASMGRAVAASSSFPGIFPPIRLQRPSSVLRQKIENLFTKKGEIIPDNLLAVDGGVFDNQGIQTLLDEKCDRIILSDAAAELKTQIKPSRWQVPVINRSQQIIYARLRELIYHRLKLCHENYKYICALNETNGKEPKEYDKDSSNPLIEGYCYIKLLPPKKLLNPQRKTFPRTIPTILHSPISLIRTDLDGFTYCEILALMYHGYSLIDQCLRKYQNSWIRENQTSKFNTSISKNLDIDWNHLADKNNANQLNRCFNHLRASYSRFYPVRVVRRVSGWINPELKLIKNGSGKQLTSNMSQLPKDNSQKEKLANQTRKNYSALQERVGKMENDQKSPYRKIETYTHFVGLVAILIATAWIGLKADPEQRVQAWVLILILMTGFAIVTGHAITGYWRGIFVDRRNKISLSRLQFIAWTILVLSAFYTAVLTNVALEWASPLEILIPGELLILLGITTGSAVGSPAILSTKSDRKADKTEYDETVGTLKDRDYTDIKKDHGVLIRNESPKGARWGDLLKGEEAGNATNVDLGKLQMFFFTFILIVGYGAAIAALFKTKGPITELPNVQEGMNVLLGISHTGYLSSKAITHTKEKKVKPKGKKPDKPETSESNDKDD